MTTNTPRIHVLLPGEQSSDDVGIIELVVPGGVPRVVATRSAGIYINRLDSIRKRI